MSDLADLVTGLASELREEVLPELGRAAGREHSGDAAARIDAIFADRLDGFRAHTLAPPSRRGSP